MKEKKEYKPCSLRMDAEVYDKMEDYCEKTGLPKTKVIEKSVLMFLEAEDKKEKILKQVKED